MKKIVSCTLALLLSLSLSACGSSDDTSKTNTTNKTSTTTAKTETSTSLPTVEPVVLEAQSSDDSVFGTLEDTFRTVFFDFCVNTVEAADSYEDILAGDDEQILIASFTVTNNGDEDIEMYDTDFILLCLDDSGDVVQDTGIWPVTAVGYDQVGKMLAPEYIVKAHQSVTGELVFIAPAEYDNFSIGYAEEFSDGTKGAYFYCDFYFNS